MLTKTNHTDTEQKHPDSSQSTEMNKHYEIDSFSSYTKNKLQSKLCNINEVTQFDVIGKRFLSTLTSLRIFLYRETSKFYFYDKV